MQNLSRILALNLSDQRCSHPQSQQLSLSLHQVLQLFRNLSLHQLLQLSTSLSMPLPLHSSRTALPMLRAKSFSQSPPCFS